nr:MAG TPA: hypothetical protein [Caudoviricetes sp.]
MTFPVPAREACQTLTHEKSPAGRGRDYLSP